MSKKAFTTVFHSILDHDFSPVPVQSCSRRSVKHFHCLPSRTMPSLSRLVQQVDVQPVHMWWWRLVPLDLQARIQSAYVV